jgi:hypothetical protein
MRTSIRRFTRLSLGFSKKWENHWSAVALWFAFYNFCRVHQSLRITPAMAAGISDHVWSVRELLEQAGYREIGLDHVDAAMAVLAGTRGGVDFPGGRLELRRGKLVLMQQKPAAK